jgi:hypothetical protein
MYGTVYMDSGSEKNERPVDNDGESGRRTGTEQECWTEEGE